MFMVIHPVDYGERAQVAECAGTPRTDPVSLICVECETEDRCQFSIVVLQADLQDGNV